MKSPTMLSRILHFLLLFSFAISLVGCRGGEPVAIASHVWPGYEPMFLARAMGWLDPKQVRLVETASATGSVKALVEGRVDGAALTLDEVLRVRGKGIPLTVVMVFDVSAGADVVLARPPIKQLADLKGKRVGYESGATGALMVTEALRRAKLSLADVQPVELTVDNHVSAWKSGRMDTIVTYEPSSSQLRGLGAVNVFDSREIPNTIVDVLAVRSDRLGLAHGAAIRHLVAAHLQALNHFRRNPQDAAYRMAPRLGLPAARVGETFRGLVATDADYNLSLLGGDAPPLRQTATKLSALMVEQHLLGHKDALDALITSDYLPHDHD